MTEPRPFLIDIGNVLCAFDFRPMLQSLRERSSDLEADPFAQFADVKDSFEAGGSSDAQFVAAVCEKIGFNGEHSEFVSLWNEIFTENQPMTRLVETLSDRGHPLYLLSNTNGMHVEYLFESFPVFAHFDGGIYSHEVMSIKPHDDIYHTAFKTYELSPAETFYIDDLPQNIAAGERLGLVSHQYDITDHKACLRWLAGHGIEV